MLLGGALALRCAALYGPRRLQFMKILDREYRNEITGDDVAVFTLTFSGDLADRNRLPFDQVIKTLQEFQEMVREVGRRIQRKAGLEKADGEFGLEVVAGNTGAAFTKGSVKATVVATIDVKHAAQTFEEILRRTKDFARQPIADDEENGVIARRMLTMAKLQVPTKTQVAFSLRAGSARPQRASLDQNVYIHLQKAKKRTMKIEGLQLFGKLRQLKDRSRTEKTDGHFWGELVTDASDVWRLRFNADMLARVLPLFMKQVLVTGDATYFGPAKNPRLSVRFVEADPERDYVKAFDALRESGVKLFGTVTTEELLAELYG